MRMQWQGPEQGYAPKYRRVVAEEMRTVSVFPGEVANIIDVRSQLQTHGVGYPPRSVTARIFHNSDG